MLSNASGLIINFTHFESIKIIKNVQWLAIYECFIVCLNSNAQLNFVAFQSKLCINQRLSFIEIQLGTTLFGMNHDIIDLFK